MASTMKEKVYKRKIDQDKKFKEHLKNSRTFANGIPVIPGSALS